MSKRQPVQKRSRERIEQILLAAADLLAKSGDADELTTTSVSKRSGVPVATVYRYFADRMAIITELIDREMAEIDGNVEEMLEALETVSLEILLDTIMTAHLRYFQANRRSIVLWFGARQSSRVLARVENRYAYMGEWVLESSRSAGFLTDEVPGFGGEGIVWLCDRVFEYLFRKERSLEEQQLIFDEFLEMMTRQISKYATPSGINGIPGDEFRGRVAKWDPVSAEAHAPD